MTYKGDSYGKAVTRFRMWGNIQLVAVLEQIPYKGVLVLAGEGGDISVLQSKIDDEVLCKNKTIAVDLDKNALEKVSEKFDNVIPILGEVGEVSSSLDYNVAHLDFCGRLSIDTIESTRKVLSNLNGTGLVGITLLKGREAKGGLKTDLWKGVTRKKRKELLYYYRHKHKDVYDSEIADHLLSLKDGKYFDPIKVINIKKRKLIDKCKTLGVEKKFSRPENVWGYQSKGKLGSLPSGLIRINALLCCVDIIATLKSNPLRKTLVSSTYTYQSVTDKDQGTPFVSSVIMVDPQYYFSIPVESQCLYYKFDVLDKFRSLSQLKNIVCSMPQAMSSKVIAPMFNLKPSTVAGWKAHYKMGTYKFKEKPAISFSFTIKGSRTERISTDWGTIALATI